MVVPFRIPDAQPVGPLASYYDYSNFVPRMDDFQQVDVVPMAALDIDEALTDFEVSIRKATCIEDVRVAHLVLKTFTARLVAIEKLALDCGDALLSAKGQSR